MNYRHISSGRASELADHVYSLGAYTQANEILALVTERDALLAALRELVSASVSTYNSARHCLAVDAARAALAKVQP